VFLARLFHKLGHLFQFQQNCSRLLVEFFFDHGSAVLRIGKAVANGLEFGFGCCASGAPVDYFSKLVYVFLMPEKVSLQNQTHNQTIVSELSRQQH
jgi:hypothetical protein